MVDISSGFTITSSRPRRSIGDVATTFRAAFASRLEKRRVYAQILRELQSYTRRDLLDMGLDPDGLRATARAAAGL